MQWDDLRVFLAIAQAGSLRRAARVLGFGQPTVIRHLRQLEQSLGILKLDGKGPLDSGYPVYVTLALIFKSDSKAPDVHQYLEFVKTPIAQKVIKDAGAIPF